MPDRPSAAEIAITPILDALRLSWLARQFERHRERYLALRNLPRGLVAGNAQTVAHHRADAVTTPMRHPCSDR